MRLALCVALLVAICGWDAVHHVAIAQEQVKPAIATGVKEPSATGPVSVEILRSPDAIRTQNEVDHANRSLSERDLAAQVRAADAAERQITAAWVAAILSGIGTVLLAATLWDTRRTSRRQLRAYLDFDETVLVAIEASGDASDWWEAHFRIKNFGETPAFGVTIDVRSHRPWRPDVVVIDDRKTPQPIGSITRGDDFTYRVSTYISLHDKERIAGDDTVVWFEAVIEYKDTFGRRRRTSATWDVTAEPGLALREGSHAMT